MGKVRAGITYNEQAVCKVCEEKKGVEDFVRQGTFLRNILKGDGGEQDVLNDIEKDDCHDGPVQLPASSPHRSVKDRVQKHSYEQDRP